MGGSSESLIKSIKRSLESITNGRTITEELLTTLLCEAESILNSRPLSSISDDITDFKRLTPNHILLVSSKPNVEPSNYENVEVNYRKKWRAVQAYTNLFWKRWLSECLPTLLPWTKWTNKQQNFALGDLVIVRNKNTPKSHWLLARILAIYPGDDGIIRTVKIQTPSGEFVRPSQLLLLLDHSKQ